ncbi:MAG: hypothetical protein J0H34_11405 [Rhizobiales bacterium]|nr:hypothetical protein [Hyphomicrobiales bacterium]
MDLPNLASPADETAPPLLDDSHYFDHVRKINDVYYDQVRLADQKAAYIFTFMIAFLVSSSEARQIFSAQRYESGEPLTIALSALVGLSLVVSLVSAILVVLPRYSEKSTSLFWGGWKTNRVKLLAARALCDPKYLFEEYLSNIDALAAISRAKFGFLRVSFRGLVVVVVGYVLLLVLQTGTNTPA